MFLPHLFKIERLFQNIIILFLSSILFLPLTIYQDIIDTEVNIKKGEKLSDNFKFKNNSEFDQYPCQLQFIGANSSYFFFVKKDSFHPITVPKQEIAYIKWHRNEKPHNFSVLN